MNNQPEALRLADALVAELPLKAITRMKSAIELRRLHEVNKVLVEALNAFLTHMGMDEDEWTKPTFDKARAALSKATGEANA